MKLTIDHLIYVVLAAMFTLLVYGVWRTIDFSSRCDAVQGKVATIDRVPVCVKSVVIINVDKP